MADVLQVPRQPDGQSYYQPSGLKRSQPSSSSLFLGTSPSGSPPPTSKLSSSPQSSLSSSPRPSTLDFSDSPSLPATPLSGGLSLEDKYESANNIAFPDYGGSKYDEVPYFGQNQDFSVPDTARRVVDVPDEDHVESTTTDTTRSDSPLPTPTVADDTAIKETPSRHVDYLSHDWREEDIWSSWRHIVSQRKVYGQRSRLENASWRTWAKSKYNLRTISPETLNWLKESDVTWLYGPLQPAPSHPLSTGSSGSTSRLSKNTSFVKAKKPILKKRTMSEVMLQKSISTSSLLKQAAASVQAQQSRSTRPTTNRAVSDFINRSLCPSEFPSRDDYFSRSTSSSPGSTPCDCSQQKRHIRFDETVEQCIAVECKEGDPAEDEDLSDDEESHAHGGMSDSSSDDGVIMMKRKKRPGLARKSSGGNTSRSNSHNGRKMIETLPTSTLKYTTDSPDPGQQPPSSQYTFGSGWSDKGLSPSPSQETLKPSHPSTNFLLRDDENKADTTDDSGSSSSTWSFGANNSKSSLGASSANAENVSTAARRDSVAVTKARNAGSYSFTLSPDDDDEEAGYDADSLRRTNSGMFMPYEEDEDDIMAAGLFGRVSETINTAKDIAHVIWNVGWRK